MTNLSEKQHWDGVHRDNGKILGKLLRFPIVKSILIWFHNWEFYTICSKYINPSYKNIFEIGCAPGNYLIKFHELFWLHPSGIEYSEPGVRVLEQNFKANNIDADIIHGDFFDTKFLSENEWKYDIVYSMGFIEHFDDPRSVIENHFRITKKDGLVIIVIPNLSYFNKIMTEKTILDIHNRTIMNIDVLRKLFDGYTIISGSYLGWFFNFGLFQYKNPILEKVRLIFFIFQRLLVDPIIMLLYKLWINLSNKYTSPSLMIICKKN